MGNRAFALTPREIAVLRCAARGLANKQIARELGVSPWTVHAHFGSIYCKLGLRGHGSRHDRTQAVVAALKAGVLELEADGG